ncbi:hypothetical protein J5N97_001697 [Dioscorea zingiberensis]|uniref:VQ domain-containing protein n=1 Tax=Dioscorea zingiberensis TaxID=325984 RepID=A0A9D5BVC6_9LILI|nr:hypothetical protein J5N97_001697 [Dioscorea zingiberensis]
MEKLSVSQRKAQKQVKSKRKAPIKVVYISNPMRFETSAAKFRELVQSVTGQDSDIDTMFEIHGTNTVGISLPAPPDTADPVSEMRNEAYHGGLQKDVLGFGSEENSWLQGLMIPSSMFYDSPVIFETPASFPAAPF